MKLDTYILPAYWASYLINGDLSGYSDEEIAEMEEFCKGLGPCINMTDEDEFSWTNDANNLGGAVATFHFLVSDG